MATFEQLMDAFGVVTVMNACIYKLKPGRSYVGRGSCVHGEENGGALKPNDFVCTGLYLDTLKIANLTQEGPTKTITGGQYANPLLKYGKTMTMAMQDALGRAPVLVEFFGCDYEDGVLSVTDRFPGAFAIEGDTFFVDQKTGEKVPVHIFIPQFLPDAILTLTQDAEGDAAVFDLNGTVSVTKIRTDENPTGKDIVTGEGKNVKDVFYQIREKSWFHPNNEPEEVEKASAEEIEDYHEEGSSNAVGEIGYAGSGKVSISNGLPNTFYLVQAATESKEIVEIGSVETGDNGTIEASAIGLGRFQQGDPFYLRCRAIKSDGTMLDWSEWSSHTAD